MLDRSIQLRSPTPIRACSSFCWRTRSQVVRRLTRLSPVYGDAMPCNIQCLFNARERGLNNNFFELFIWQYNWCIKFWFLLFFFYSIFPSLISSHAFALSCSIRGRSNKFRYNITISSSVPRETYQSCLSAFVQHFEHRSDRTSIPPVFPSSVRFDIYRSFPRDRPNGVPGARSNAFRSIITESNVNVSCSWRKKEDLLQ